MLYAAGIETEEQMRNVPQVGTALPMPMATGLVEPGRVDWLTWNLLPAQV